MRDTESLSVTLKVTNTGNMDGMEVVQLYIAPPEGRLLRPEKELKKFAKIHLNAGETKEIGFTLTHRDFACYDPELMDWYVPSGEYGVCICRSAAEIALSATVEVKSTTSAFRKLYLDSQHKQVFAHPDAKRLYLDFLVEKGALKAADVARMAPLLLGNYMGIYNVVTSLLGAKVSKEEMQGLLDKINIFLGSI